MATTNARLRDLEVDHAIDLRNYSVNVVRRMIAVLNRADAAIFSELVQRLRFMTPETFTIERLDALLDSVQALNRAAYASVNADLRLELRALTEAELAFQRAALTASLPPAFPWAAVSLDVTYAAAMARPFQGALLKEFLADQSLKKARMIRQTIADGFVQGQTTDVIVRRLRGTRAAGYADGLLEITRRDAQTIVRTALSHTASFAQQQFYDANQALLKGYLWSATLDARTSSLCQVRDNKEYDLDFQPVGHSYAWGAGPGRLHYNCRSRRSPLVKSWRDLGVPMDDFTPDERASMDGTVPAEQDYAAWLKAQSAARQNEALGPARGALFRAGGLALKDLYDAQGAELTLEELRKRRPGAFEKVGL